MITLPADKKVKLSNGEEIGYRKRKGGEKTILLVHGNMTSSKHWDLFFETFSNEYTLIAIDMRGFGESSYKERINSIQDFAEDLKYFVDEMKLEDFTLIGWSTGGAVCMQFEAQYPGYCNKLVLIASASTRGYPFFEAHSDGTPNFDRRLQTVEEVEKDLMRTIPIQQAYDTNNRELLKTIWNSLIYTHNQPDKERYEAYVDDMLTQRNLADVYHALNTFNISSVDNVISKGTNQAKDVAIPVLVLRGERDLVITKEMADEIAQDLGDYATFKELPESGHSPFVDDVEQLNAIIVDFLEK
ncbi:intracellular short-chain-length polyhydroxyalkanoate depolymerase [Guptibacillus algicola]|uniref:intracellular short-chain-length polyhydroxyalkanoate depolymerase n=1 Tax=Guptibacillus algicola TaxID=225844 RepID=UPI001CD42074|nr:alpha/beta hydrolase [Alkalihalobacillus algicola]MCA0986961.1 alpha/beta hydrolase [Alkalihalobacillus algicola]